MESEPIEKFSLFTSGCLNSKDTSGCLNSKDKLFINKQHPA